MNKPKSNESQAISSASNKKSDSAPQRERGNDTTATSSKTYSYRENRDKDRENRDKEPGNKANTSKSFHGSNGGKFSGSSGFKSYRNHSESEHKQNKNPADKTENRSNEKSEKVEKPEKVEKALNNEVNSKPKAEQKERDRDREGKAKRPSLQIYNPAQRAAQREQKKDQPSPQS
jgi:hypothetical protein